MGQLVALRPIGGRGEGEGLLWAMCYVGSWVWAGPGPTQAQQQNEREQQQEAGRRGPGPAGLKTKQSIVVLPVLVLSTTRPGDQEPSYVPPRSQLSESIR